MKAALHRDLTHARQLVDRRHVADCEHLRVTRQAQVGQHRDAA